MTIQEFEELLLEIQKNKFETRTLELKAAKEGCPKRLYDSLSSFSNQDDGGIIVFGIDEKNDYDECGVYDVNDIQKQINNQCLQMVPKIRPLFTVLEKDGKYFVAAEIPAVDIVDRPCYYEGVGRLKGSYTRVGDSDEPMTEYEVYSFEAYRQKYQDDIRVVERASYEYINRKELNRYLEALKQGKPNLALISEKEICKLMCVEKDGFLTLGAVLAFGIYPQAYFPQLSIIATVVPGIEIGDTGDDGERFLDNQRIDGNLVEMLDGALNFVKRNMKVSTIIDENTGKRKDKTQYPIPAVREAVLNALVHRDYSIHTEGKPIQLIMYEDRIEVINPGGLYGRITVDQLGKVQPDTRNPLIANILEQLDVTENRYSGIPTIRRTMKDYGLPVPIFKDERGEFTTVLYNSNANEYNKYGEAINFVRGVSEGKNLGENMFLTGSGFSIRSGYLDMKNANIIKFLSVPRSREEIAKFLGIESVSYAIKKNIEPLVEQGVVKLTIPEKPKSKNQKYYTSM